MTFSLNSSRLYPFGPSIKLGEICSYRNDNLSALFQIIIPGVYFNYAAPTALSPTENILYGSYETAA